MNSDLFKNNVTYKLFTYIYMCVCMCVNQDLALDNLQGLMCHKTQANQP